MGLSNLGGIRSLAGLVASAASTVARGALRPASSMITYTGQTPTLAGLALLIAAGSGANVTYASNVPTVSIPAIIASGAGSNIGVNSGGSPTLDTGGVTLSQYAVGSNDPDVVADFKNEYYRVAGSDTDFDTMFTYTNAGIPTTMVDSDGNLKWCPHNLVLQSESIVSPWSNIVSRFTITNAVETYNNVSMARLETSVVNQHEIRQAITVRENSTFLFEAIVKYEDMAWMVLRTSGFTANPVAYFDISSTGAVGTSTFDSESITALGSGYFYIQAQKSVDTDGAGFVSIMGAGGDGNLTAAANESFLVGGIRVYYNDLGGMVNVPTDARVASGAAFATYVPTTTAAEYLPRRGNHVWNDYAWINKGIQLETEERTNLCKYSYVDDSAGWSASSTSDAAGTSFLGLDVTTVTSSSTTGNTFINSNTSANNIDTYCMSIFAKANSLSTVSIRLGNGGNYIECNFDLSGGTAGSITTGGTGVGVASGIIDCGSGVYRCWMAGNTIGNGSIVNPAIYPGTSTTGTGSVDVAEVQVELGSTPSSLIPTGSSNATVTRAAETLIIPAANMSYSTTAMSFQINGLSDWDDTRGLAYGGAGTNNDRLEIYGAPSLNRYYYYLRDSTGGISTTFTNTGFAEGLNAPFNLAIRMKSDGTTEAGISSNGGTVARDDTFTGIQDFATDGDDFTLFNSSDQNSANGNITLFRQWDVDIGDTGIVTASLPIDTYAVAQYSPLTVADFENEYYRALGLDTTFDGMLTYTGTTLTTMVDSDGYIKWCPHNLLTYSEDFSNAVYTANNCTITSGGLLTATGAASVYVDRSTLATNSYGDFTLEARVEQGTARYFYISWQRYNNSNGGAFFDLDTVSVTRVDNFTSSTIPDATASIVENADGSFTCKVTGALSITSGLYYYGISPNDGTGVNLTNKTGAIPVVTTGDVTGQTITIKHVAGYRSDLGGIVENPDGGTGQATYVPTTTAAKYLPRRGNYVYNGSSWVNKGIQLETEARTNLTSHSTEFTNAAWTTQSGTSFTDNDATGPDGATSASTMDEGTDTSFKRTYDRFDGISTSQPYCFSVYLKYVDRQWARISFTTSSFNNAGYMDIDLTDGSVVNTGSTGSATLSDYGVIDCGNGWYRCFVVVTLPSTPGFAEIYMRDDTTNHTTTAAMAYTGTNKTMLVYGAQMELNAYTPSSYIPTSGGTVARAAETLTIAAANMSASTSAMSFHMKGTMDYTDLTTSVDGDGASGEVIPYRWFTDASNFISAALDTDTGGTGGWVWEQEDAGTNDAVSGSASELAAGVNVAFNIAARHTSSALNGASAGTAATENSTPTTLDNLSAVNFESGYKLNGNITLFRQWAVDLGDTGIATAST